MRKRKAAVKVISLITVRGPLLLGRATKQIQCPKLCAKNPLVQDDKSSEVLAKARVLVNQIWPTTFTSKLFRTRRVFPFKLEFTRPSSTEPSIMSMLPSLEQHQPAG